MINKLVGVGLSEREAQVYLAALELGPSTVEQIAKQAGIIRSTSYTQIESLVTLGLMSTYDEGKKTYYVPESPDNLKRILQNKLVGIEESRTDLKKLLPSLTTLYDSHGSRPTVRMFKGKAGLIAARSEILKMKGKDLIAAISYDDFRKVFSDPQERNEFTKKRQKKKIKVKAIYSTNGKLQKDEYAPEEVKVVEESAMPFEFDVLIFDEKVVLYSVKDTIWGVILEGKIIANSMRTLFDLAWQTLK